MTTPLPALDLSDLSDLPSRVIDHALSCSPPPSLPTSSITQTATPSINPLSTCAASMPLNLSPTSSAVQSSIPSPTGPVSVSANPLDLWLSASQQLASIDQPLRNLIPPAVPPAVPSAVPLHYSAPEPVMYASPSHPPPRLSTVDAAKRNAETFTMSQLARKRRAAGLDPFPKRRKPASSSVSDGEDEDKFDAHQPEQVSHRKYQKRLQKNRDSAFVSRIRRREYTRLLENSLTNVEREKDDAVSKYFDLKNKFDKVCAELSAYKQAMSASFSAPQEAVDTSHVQRSSGLVTSMFMFTLLCGVLMPDFANNSFGANRYGSSSTALTSKTSAMPTVHSQPATVVMNSSTPHEQPSSKPSGKLWTLSANSHLEHGSAGEQHCLSEVLGAEDCTTDAHVSVDSREHNATRNELHTLSDSMDHMTLSQL